MSHSEEVVIEWVPTESSHSRLPRLLKLEPPQGKEHTFIVSILITRIFIVLEVYTQCTRKRNSTIRLK